MDERDDTGELAERQRTWRMFVSHVRWFVAAAAAVLLLVLLLLRSHG